MTGAPSWTDAEMLQVLELRRDAGLSAAKIAVRFGVRRNAIIGLLNGIDTDLAKVPDTAMRPENRNGGMPARWWADGLKVQGRAAT